MKKVKTYTAVIYCGTLDIDTGNATDIKAIETTCQKYCDKVGLCVSLIPVTFIYTGGREEGVSITLINYPRFPARKKEIREKAIEIARLVQYEAKQKRVSIVCSDRTIMLISTDKEEEI